MAVPYESQPARAAFGLFAQWLELDAAERTALLARSAAQDPVLHERLLALIRADRGAEQAAFLADNAMLDVAATQAPEPDADASGQRIGAWILAKRLGTGGMGQVWLAHRSDGQHQGVAAIKMLRVAIANADANARFAQEGRILAQLAHPHISMLLDAGFTEDGQRYLVLEYVDGQRIDLWCEACRLDLAARLRLFLQVCEAVTHAHAHLIVHRDLKPSNILVLGDGTAKLLDFGIAKLLEADAGMSAQLTGDTLAALTPAYAAPEQLTGAAITIATDVYALGVILYLLLCGRNPHGSEHSTPAQLARAVMETEPGSLFDFDADSDIPKIAAARTSTPERLRRALRGDLAVIVAKALKKHPVERYSSVQALADDLRRHLDHRPIAARADSALYRLRKFARRNWLPLGAGMALVLVVIVSSAMLAWEARKTAREAQATVVVKDFLFGLFNAVDPDETKGRDISARELLDRGRLRVGADAHGDPLLKAELQSVLGRIYSLLGLYQEAGELQQHAVEVFKANDPSSTRLAQAEIDYAYTLREKGDLKSAATVSADASAHLHALPEASAQDFVKVLTSQASIAISQRDFAAAKRFGDAAVTLCRQSLVGDFLLANSLVSLGNAEWGLKSLDRAEADYREALRLMTLTQGADSWRVGVLHGDLAMLMRSRSRYAQALQESAQGLAIDEKALGAKHPKVLAERGNLGLTYYHLGQYGQARVLLEQVALAQRAQAGVDNPVQAGTLLNLGLDLIEIPDLDAAEKAYTESLRIWEKNYGREYPGAQVALAGLGTVHVLQGRFDRAEAELAEVQKADEKRGAQDDASVWYWLGEMRRRQKSLASAVSLDRQALLRAQHEVGEHHRYTALAHHYLGLALRDSGDSAGAEQELRAALASFGYIPNARIPWAATTRLELGKLLATRADARDESRRLLSEAVAVREQFFGAEDPRTIEARAATLSVRGGD
jgi:serine/threonine-protein kinase